MRFFSFHMMILSFIAGLYSGIVFSVPHKPIAFLQAIQGKPDEGAQIVQHYCAMCHAEDPQVHIGAPRIGHVSDWELRLKQSRETLWRHTVEGLRAMPPRGGCFECTDAQIKKAIDFITKDYKKTKRQK